MKTEKTNKHMTDEQRRERRRHQALVRRRRKAAEELGCAHNLNTSGLVYSATVAAEIVGVGVATFRKNVEPVEHAPNPRYSNVGAPVGLYDPRDLRKAKTGSLKEAVAKYESRKAAAQKAVATRVDKMIRSAEVAELRIDRGKTPEEIRKCAIATHGGNYRGDPGEFRWCGRTARNCIRHNFTNYESLWSLTNRGDTGRDAYEVLRERVDDLISDAYPWVVAMENDDA